ncbi:MAG: SUMF1/EgtB/PvdO family nonheme iron enzyme [Verrucomicrobiota bacterium]
MDLTPQSLRKKNARKRVPVFGIARHRKNPFQKAIVGVVLVSFIAFSVVERIQQRRGFERQQARAEELRGKLDTLDAQTMSIHTRLQQLRKGTVFIGQSDEERSLERRLEELNLEMDGRFAEFNECFAAIPFRYRSKYEIQQRFADYTQQRIESTLARKDYDRARLCYNASPVRELLSGIKSRVKGEGSLEIIGPESVHDVMVWPMLEDETTPRMLQGDAIWRGKPPFQIKEIDKGSYVLQVTCGDGQLIPYPVHIGHGEQKQVELEIPGSVPDGMVHVPGGDFLFGGEDSRFYRKRRLSLPAFFIKKHEVTVAEYLEFWKSLDDPGLRSTTMSHIHFDQEDHHDAWDEQGKLADERLDLEYPVIGISHEAADAFCEWKSRQTGATIRLPTVEEWEKAARGVDGRRYVWGNGYDPKANLALVKGNEKGKARFPLWAPPGKFMRDVSVYGAYDMAGNVREMTSTPLPNKMGYQLKGGSAFTSENYLPCSHSSDTPVAPSDVGFRYVREVAGK